MKQAVLLPMRNALSAGVSHLSGIHIPPEAFHLPARNAPASVFLPAQAREPYRYAAPGDAFPAVLGVPPVGRTSLDDSFLVLWFTDAFYDALVSFICRTLVRPESDLGRLSINRMTALSRKSGTGCPADEAARQLLWQLVCLYERPAGFAEAERAAASYLTHLPPRERMHLAGDSGAFAGAAARILHAFASASIQ